MTHPCRHAATNPEKTAIIIAETGEAVSYAQLDAASNRAAHFFRGHGLSAGDTIALLLDNIPDYYSLIWGAQRSGLRFVCISTRLTAGEIDYILVDSGAQILIATAAIASVAQAITTPLGRFAVGGTLHGFDPIEPHFTRAPSTPIADETSGQAMLYSSGTTGRPKGVVRDGVIDPDIAHVTPLMMLAAGFFGLSAEAVYLSTAPLYHAAPLAWTMTVHQMGGTVVLMKAFDPEAALAHIARYRCNAGQFVPTHFIRMLKLPDHIRLAYDTSSMKTAIHAAAPCPVPVKQAMIAWWGPVIDEYYAGTEGNGFTAIKAAEWLERPGSVGRSIGEAKLHICDADGNILPARQEGGVFFEGPRSFVYHNDPEKTAESRNQHGWTTLGDVGWVDEEGYLYLTDRKSFMIISGGVNIYPQEIENRLVTHPKVADVAVIGGPHPEMGEEVIAIVQPADMSEADDTLRQDLIDYARETLSGVKIPRRIDFVAQLPRHDTGKLYKRLLRDQYWEKAKSS
jgi:long-chain acyl-CoA synthetase